MAVDMKQLIAETLARLLERKSVDKITVKELVETCGISRQAFYYHFQDIVDRRAGASKSGGYEPDRIHAPGDLEDADSLSAGKQEIDPAFAGLPAACRDRTAVGSIHADLSERDDPGESGQPVCQSP